MTPPGFTERPRIGMLGGGQLAKMLAEAALRLGCRVHILDRAASAAPLFDAPVTVGDWDDPAVLLDFARTVDVVTLENEFVEAEALEELEAHGVILRPGADTMRRIQDKLHQKETLRDANLVVPAFRPVATPEDIVIAARDLGWPLVLKRRKLGYDGKGNATLQSPADVAHAWERLGGDINALYVEQWCPFAKELAVIVTRAPHQPPVTDHRSPIVAYPVVETVQRDHICHTVTAPANVDASVAARATELARRAVEAVDGVGSFGVELFLTADGRVLINELAPRVHNSGHYTIEACACSQFENHIRAVLGWPLGSPELVAPAAAMVNLLGAGDGPPMPIGLDAALAVPGTHVHIYGKDRSVKGRKMGHITALGPDASAALATAQRAAALLRFG